MGIGTIIFILAILALIVIAFIGIEIKKIKRKLIAIFLIGLILFTFFSVRAVFKGKEVDLKTLPGVMNAIKIYFSWLGGFLSNVKSITTSVIRMNWTGNTTK